MTVEQIGTGNFDGFEFARSVTGADDTTIWVSPYGDDTYGTGVIENPYLTVNAGIAAITSTKKTVHILNGDYTVTTDINITVNGTKIIGIGSVNINCSGCTTYGFKTVFGAATGTKEVTFKNLTIDAGAKVGIQVDNVGATAKVNLYLTDVEIYNTNASYSAVDINHTVAGTQAIRLYANRCIFKGKIDAVIGDNGDRLRFDYCELRGGLVTNAGNYDAEIRLFWSVFLLNGITGGHSNQRVIFGASISETNADPNVYLEAVNADVDQQTPQVIAFDAP